MALFPNKRAQRVENATGTEGEMNFCNEETNSAPLFEKTKRTPLVKKTNRTPPLLIKPSTIKSNGIEMSQLSNGEVKNLENRQITFSTNSPSNRNGSPLQEKVRPSQSPRNKSVSKDKSRPWLRRKPNKNPRFFSTEGGNFHIMDKRVFSSQTPTKLLDHKYNKSEKDKSYSDSDLLAAIELYKSSPEIYSYQTFNGAYFGRNSGVSDGEVRGLLNSSAPKLKNKMELAVLNAAYLKRFRSTLERLFNAKNKFVTSVTSAEQSLRYNWYQSLVKGKSLMEERDHYKNIYQPLKDENEKLKESLQDAFQDCGDAEERIFTLEAEIKPLKARLADAERIITQDLIALEVAQVRNEEASKQAESWKSQVIELEKAKANVQRSSNDLASEKISLEENKKLSIKIKELEGMLATRDADLSRISAENKSYSEKLANKDKDLSDLMKGLGDIQLASQTREQEANKLRQNSEAKALTLERELNEVRNELKLMAHDKATLNQNLAVSKSRSDFLEKEAEEMSKKLEKLKEELSSITSQYNFEKELRSRADIKEAEERTERIAISAQMVAMTKEHANMQSQLKESIETSKRKLDERQKEENERLEAKEKELSDVRSTVSGLEFEVESLREALQQKDTSIQTNSTEEISRLKGEIIMLRERIESEKQRSLTSDIASSDQVAALTKEIHKGQAERRRLHNVIQELRGNIRVFARIRPFLPCDEVPDDTIPSIVPRGDSSLKIVVQNNEANPYEFSFNRVFAPSAGQDAIFKEVSEFVQSALDGYNVCLFSYGQTGSGKTHTMQGSGVGQMRGLIPRAIEQVGEYKNQLESEGWKYQMKVSFLEIYNETIRDLLRTDEDEEIKHEVKVDKDGRRFVSNLTLEKIEPTDHDAVEEIMQQAAKHRSVASTNMNDVSSRSHSVFTLHLTAVHPKQKQALRGTLNLVDLAGSERLDRSGVTGDRAKETVAINKSLSSLTDVFTALAKKSSHVPFRNSKLTYLLQPSLSGNGKTLMLVNLSPTDTSSHESLCSLRFASQVNKCELGKAIRSVEEMKDDSSTQHRRSKIVSPSQKLSSGGFRSPRKSNDEDDCSIYSSRSTNSKLSTRSNRSISSSTSGRPNGRLVSSRASLNQKGQTNSSSVNPRLYSSRKS